MIALLSLLLAAPCVALAGDLDDAADTVVWTERGGVLPVAVEELRGDPEARSTDEGVLKILGCTESKDGAELHLQVLGVAPGRATVEVAGRSVVVEVKDLPAEARAWSGVPQFSGPVEVAVLSGEIAVGVEWTRGGAAPDVEARLELPDGTRRAPVGPHASDGGPTRRRRFVLDADALGSGEHRLAVVLVQGAVEVAREELGVEVAVPEDGALGGECEAALGLERPEVFVSRAPRAGRAKDASGGSFVSLPRGDFTWVAPVEVPRSGRYQLFVRARGDIAGGAFPSIGASVDAPTPYVGTARIVDHRWHRLPVGPPVFLAEGQRHLGLRLINDLDVGERSDRSLDVDAWELVPVPADAGGGGGSMMMMEDGGGGPRGPKGPGLWVALDRPLHGLEVNGRLRIHGAVNWSGAADPVPRVELLVDGEARAEQQTARPLFALDRAHLGEGEHTIELRASLPDGRVASTPVQTVEVHGPVAPAIPRDAVRFDVADERWNGDFHGCLTRRGEEERQRVARPRRPLTAEMDLPEALEGRYRIALEARGGEWSKPGTARLTLRVGGESTEPKSALIRNWWDLRDLGVHDLQPGPKSLTLELAPHEGEPEMRVRSLVLSRVRDGDDVEPPSVELLYPAAGHVAHGVDGLVARAHDDDELGMVDVLIDGRPQGVHGYVPEGAGHVFLPLLLRDVEPGEHLVSVRVQDRSGNLAESEAVLVTVAAGAPERLGTFARAVHLLNRLAFGPDPAELCELLVAGEEEWLRRALAQDSAGDAAMRGLSDVRAGDRIVYDGDRMVMVHALRTDEPVRLRHTLWVDDHFSTWMGKTGAPSEWAEHREIARLGWAPFGEQLRASATSGVMLSYLDQDGSYAGRINENYARELLELHTVGVDGGYAQEDVTELAHLLAGLTVSQEAPADGSGVYQRRHFRFDPELSDGRSCTLFGLAFERAGRSERFPRFERVLDLLARRPETSRFIARKLAEHYVAVPAPPVLVDDLAAVFRASGGDFREVLTALVAHGDFWGAMDTPRLATPLDYGVRVARTATQPILDGSVRNFLKSSGMGLFDRESPDGYPDEDEAWSDTNGLMQRWRWVESVPWGLRGLLPDACRNYTAGDPHAYRQRVVDHIAVRLTGRLLSEESNGITLSYFEEQEGNSWEQAARVLEFICRLPEANLK